ncbi:MAG: selenide, water dikinase SelD [Bacteroidetes bacterium]|nr:selenide, water dikinase SelD [Bacteroidota bacterium]
MEETKIKLTQYSHGAGCGCKISPAVLDTILHTEIKHFDSRLLVGNSERDDAAVVDMEDGTALISTTDFFMPIVDDAFDFGRVAATNAISDIYAMGGKPLVAIAILGWPIDKLSPEVAKEVLEGARTICNHAGISIAGGHSIDSPEPIFGLAVNGTVKVDNLKRNSTATVGSRLYLTKPIGIGVLSTAQKKGVLNPDDAEKMLKNMTTLNRLGEQFAQMKGVTAMTDVTGFGLLGHLAEMSEGCGLSAEIVFDKIPIISSVKNYIEMGCIPGGTNRNWKSYGHKVSDLNDFQKNVLADPQTSGGLMVAVDENAVTEFEKWTENEGIKLTSFGFFKERSNKIIEVK